PSADYTKTAHVGGEDRRYYIWHYNNCGSLNGAVGRWYCRDCIECGSRNGLFVVWTTDMGIILQVSYGTFYPLVHYFRIGNQCILEIFTSAVDWYFIKSGRGDVGGRCYPFCVVSGIRGVGKKP